MPEYLRPGAYTERVDTAPPNRLLLRSDVAAFVGIAEKGPVDVPVPIESFRQFQAHFGSFIGAGYLAYCVRAFFDNGGRRCWVVRVAARNYDGKPGLGATSARLQLKDIKGNNVWTVQASSEGSWGNGLMVALAEESIADSFVARGESSAFYARVSTTAGFERGTLVLISQEDSRGNLQNFQRVISFVDEQRQRLYWQHPEPGMGLVYDQPLHELDANRPARITSISYRLIVMLRNSVHAVYSKLSLIPEHPNYGPKRLAPCRACLQPRLDDRAIEAPEPIVIVSLREQLTTIPERLLIAGLAANRLRDGQDGLACLSHRDFIGTDFSSRDTDNDRRIKNRGISSLKEVEEITLLAIPDIVIQPREEPVYQPETPPEPNPCIPCPPPPEQKSIFVPYPGITEQPPVFSDEQIFQVQAAMVAFCEERGDCFAVLDTPYHIADNATSGIAEVQAWRNRFASSYAALYYPWVKVIEPRDTGSVRTIPPSGHALGQYALLDNEYGVHRAPANRPLQWTQDLSLHTTYGQQELLNPSGINVLRSEGPRGIRIMGARTVSCDPDWRYVNVRRLMIMIRRTVRIISQWVIFEPNSVVTRNKLQVAISSYLTALWTRGALTGAVQGAAFFVKCDEENNPGCQRDSGQLIAEIGVAPSIPFEFVIVRVGLQENELNIKEVKDAAAAA